jgi:hypothetical protein
MCCNYLLHGYQFALNNVPSSPIYGYLTHQALHLLVISNFLLKLELFDDAVDFLDALARRSHQFK